MTARGNFPARVRKGRLEDLAQVKEFTQNTFSWGDYLPDAWAAWVRSKRGTLFVAEVESRVVGTCHLRLLEHREGWLEGLRVHHAFRKMGIASQLIQATHQEAARQNCRVIRLETGSHNLAAQRAFENFGYRRVVRYSDFEADAREAKIHPVRSAKPADLGACWKLWQASWMKDATHDVVPAPYGWRWWQMTQARLRDEIRSGRVWICTGGFMILRQEIHAFDVTLLVGSKRAALKLLDAARALAFHADKERVAWIAPRVTRSTQWAAEAGYTLDEDGLLIYACAL